MEKVADADPANWRSGNMIAKNIYGGQKNDS